MNSGDAIPLPRGGGALKGIGETFTPNPQTGTGSYAVPIQVPAGRAGLQPDLRLVYNSGDGNGPFGYGWSLPVSGVSRLTTKGVPRYRDEAGPSEQDIFVLAGAEELVEVEASVDGAATTRRYRPRTEGLFAQIERRLDGQGDVWTVRTPSGQVSTYGSADPAVDATVADPDDPRKIFGWRITETRDPFGNRIQFRYRRDRVSDGRRAWDQLYPRSVAYVDLAGTGQAPFLVEVALTYDDEPPPPGVTPVATVRARRDPWSQYRAGFEIRTRRRWKWIVVSTHPAAGVTVPVRAYELVYLDEIETAETELPVNGASLLAAVHLVGFDDAGVAHRELPPLRFGYSRLRPGEQDLTALTGDRLPSGSVLGPEFALVDLFGCGLPDLLELGDTARYWRNLGDLRFDRPREIAAAPAGLRLDVSGVQVVDVDGDARPDLLVTAGGVAGYYPLDVTGPWGPRSFRRFDQAPSFNLEDREVRLVDLTGDGVTDAVRSGTRFECFFNDAARGWLPGNTARVERGDLTRFPDVSFADPRVKVADLSGDGLCDIALVHSGRVDYWPSLGYGRWAARITMAIPGRLPFDFDPARVVLGDVDGDGVADLVYVDDRAVTIWFNRGGTTFSAPLVIGGTPPLTNTDTIRLVDLRGTGTAGLLWSRAADGSGRPNHFFLDLTGGLKPYLLTSVDNNLGAVTTVHYVPSTTFYVADVGQRRTRWRTNLPFPVQVVGQLGLRDVFSETELTSEYRYHHGHWDGFEHEYRGFALVEQFDRTRSTGPEPWPAPPVMVRSWYHLGPVARGSDGDWRELDWSQGTDRYWAGDPGLLGHVDGVNARLVAIPVAQRRAALRALRGRLLRSETYTLDGSPRESLPSTVVEQAHTVRAESNAGIFTPLSIAERTTRWERGDDPHTELSYRSGHDDVGQPTRKLSIACPRGWRSLADTPAEGYLAALTHTVFARPDPAGTYLRNRVARVRTFEVVGTGGRTVPDLAVLTETSPQLRVVGESRNFYDRTDDPTAGYGAFVGRDFGQVGPFGALVRTETLVMTRDQLQAAHGTVAAYLMPAPPPAEYPVPFLDALAPLAGYQYRAAGPDNSEGYVATTARRYDFHTAAGTGRGLVQADRDPLGNESIVVEYDFDLLPARVRDAAGLEVAATYHPRTLQPAEVTDPNGNLTRLAYSPIGLVTDTWTLGKPAAAATDRRNAGDRVAPSVHVEYDFRAYLDSLAVAPAAPRPIVARVIQRVRHDSDPEDDGQTVEVREYSDGLGRSLQTRTQGEAVRFGDERYGGGDDILPGSPTAAGPTTVVGRLTADPARPPVTVTGWQRYDAKGRVVEKYERFWDQGWEYARPDPDQLRHRITMYYAPGGQLVRTVFPDASERLVVPGVPTSLDDPPLDPADTVRYTPTPWISYTYDANDNAGRTHAAEAAGYRHHWNTPGSIEVDALGRTVRTVARTRAAPADATAPLAPVEEHATVSRYSISGDVLEIRDPLGRPVFQYQYDHAHRALASWSLDGGWRATVWDAAGGVLEERDAKGALRLSTVDPLHRATRLWARDRADGAMTLRELYQYGDDPAVPGTPEEKQANNLLHQVWRSFDESGLVEVGGYDFSGRPLTLTQWVLSDNQLLGLAPTAAPVDWAALPPPELDPVSYETRNTFDALHRLTSSTLPVCSNGDRYRLVSGYTAAGDLESVGLVGPLDATGQGPSQAFIDRIAYNARGQRVLLAYGNGLLTRLAYDEATSRLARVRTQRFDQPAATTLVPTGPALQDATYTYDLTGNSLRIASRTTGCGVRSGAQGPDALDRVFAYDPLYRLVGATGRECATLAAGRPWADYEPCGFNQSTVGTPSPANAPDVTTQYRENYEYDPAGNLLALRHVTLTGSTWVRYFGMAGLRPQEWLAKLADWRQGRPVDWGTGGNRMTHAGAPDAVEAYTYDAVGNLGRETTERRHEWDHRNRLASYRNQVDGAAPTIEARYLYDAAGARVKKLVRTGNGYRTTVYIGGTFEHHRVVRGAAVAENCTLNVVDHDRRVASVRVGDPFDDDGAADHPIRYELIDLVRSTVLTVGADATTMWSEEFFPFGETSFGGFARKRYRFAGHERDDESGLVHIGVRYYSPWTARWTSVDPANQAGQYPYAFASNSPLTLADHDGRASGVPLENKGAGNVSDHFAEILDRYGWNYSREVKCTVNGIPAQADKIMSPPGMPNRRFWLEEKREDPALFDSLSSYTPNQCKYVPLLKGNARPVPKFDRSNVDLKANQAFDQEYVEFDWHMRKDFENFVRSNTPNLTPPKSSDRIHPWLRVGGAKIKQLVGVAKKATASGGGLLLAGALIALGSASSANAATRQESDVLTLMAPALEKYLVDHPDRGILIAARFRVGDLTESYTYTSFLGFEFVAGQSTEEGARKAYGERSQLTQNIQWHENHENVTFTWVPPLDTRTVTVTPDR